ncbi:integrase [Pararhizobium capsulatum DSM 1112]|uniref:Integrase n=1 Tax=Pararhizobium capsulatum DSM 1112 TaxID=1121113 RepID=A0ABU0BP14_9HYPH|nr:tyrosine-type recombinase/integrase [Pararhizobium capsulatum]MDQ0319991.1 integrase [Pararhizobium capsulatum DSM 1112]
MKIDYPGLIRQELPSGSVIYRVRPKNQHSKRVQLYASPGDPDFSRQYDLARKGIKPDIQKKPSEQAMPETIGWLVHAYFEYLEERVKAGTTSAKTLKKKRNLLNRLLKKPDKKMQIPREKLIGMQDGMGSTPAQADAFIEAVGVMFDWGVDRKYLKENTARGIKSVYRKGDGATPWKADDVKAFFAKHKAGSTPHVAMSVLLWTGCRIEDLTMLGPSFECVIDGVEALRWIPMKKGSTEVCIPFLDPLKVAVRAPTILGTTYVIRRGAKAYASGDAMSAMFKRWCVDANLGHLSAHGVRKGLAEVLAELGCSQYEIMAILGHSEAKTSEVYTRRVERWNLAKTALSRVNTNSSWG